jgi:phosphatidylglycerol:prolipoprotein diacylglycerol transferase
MSNAQVAALASAAAGVALIGLARAKNVQWTPELVETSQE